MRRAAAIAAAALLFWSLPLVAGAPDHSLRPVGRGGAATGAEVPAATAPEVKPRSRPAAAVAVATPVAETPRDAVTPSVHPKPRPESAQIREASARPATLPSLGPKSSHPPLSRPDEVEQEALFKKRKKRKGSVCGDIDIQGEAIGRVPGSGSCGIKDAVRVTSVDGVRLSPSATIDCPTAKALKTWVERGVKPTFSRRGPVVELKVAAHYACRTRNNQRGARLSEHARGKAIDISAFVMRDGEVITVAKGWGQGTTNTLLQKAWRTACGPFGTVLGPRSDSYHRDHFHLDTASYRSGPYCK